MPSYLQTSKTQSNILKRYEMKKDEPKVVQWDELTWDDKKGVFESYYPNSDVLDGNMETYYLGDFPSLRQTQPENLSKWLGGTLVWVELNRNFTPEFFYWLLTEKMKRDETYMEILTMQVKQVQDRLLDKQINEKAYELTQLKWRKLPEDQQDDESFEKIYEQVKNFLELDQE